MSTFLYRLGRSSALHPWRVLGLWALAAIIVVASSAAFGRELEDSFEVPGLDSQEAIDLLESVSSDRAGLTALVVVTPTGDNTFFEDADARTALAEVQRSVADLPMVINATDPVGALATGPSDAVASGAVSTDGRVALVRVQYPVLEDLHRADLDNLTELVDSTRTEPTLSSVQVEAGGDLFFAFDEGETGTGELVGLVAAVVILLVAFGSLIAMGLPVGMAIFGLALGISAMGLVTYLIDIPAWAPQMASMIGLGVGIDYALFLVTRHRELLHDGHSVTEAAGRAVATAGQAVLFAGGTVVIAILGLAVAGLPFMTAAGVATSMIVLLMVLGSLTLLPAFLGLAGHRIDGFGLRRARSGRSAAKDGVSENWIRWGSHVTRNAWRYTIGVTALLLALTAPVLALDLGFPDQGTQPTSQTERRAYDLVAEGFGPGINGPLLVAVDLAEVTAAAGEALVSSLASAVASDSGIAGVAPAEVDTASGVATLVAFPTTAPQDKATFATVERLRSHVLPGVLDGQPVDAHVGGQTANFGDVANQVKDRLPAFIAAVIALSFVLLMIVFRSILVPLKAALLNLLSIGSAYGVLVAVFQWGWGKELIGLETTVPIVSFIPMFMFAVLFGLSMDYEVFLLSRVREEYRATGDNDVAVIRGLASTARVITSAALIMISVFGAFVFGEDPVIKMMGLGLATAIFVDATIVRMVLVPASMRLMGDANWWLPAWLDRILPNVDIDGAEAVFEQDDADRQLAEPSNTRELVRA